MPDCQDLGKKFKVGFPLVRHCPEQLAKNCNYDLTFGGGSTGRGRNSSWGTTLRASDLRILGNRQPFELQRTMTLIHHVNTRSAWRGPLSKQLRAFWSRQTAVLPPAALPGPSQ